MRRGVVFMKNIPLYHVEPIRDLKEMLEKSANTFGEKAAFLKKDILGGPYIPVSYTQYKKDVDALGTALIHRGCKGERIAIIGENRYEWVCFLSCSCKRDWNRRSFG